MQISLFSLFKRRPKRAAPTPPPDSALTTRWQTLIKDYFPEREDLKEYHVAWSRRRQRRTLGSCNITLRRVRIATELNHPACSRWVEAVLYHELCHAVLGTKRVSKSIFLNISEGIRGYVLNEV